VRSAACAVASPETGAPAPRSGVHGNGGVLSSECTVILGSEATL